MREEESPPVVGDVDEERAPEAEGLQEQRQEEQQEERIKA